MFINEYGNRNDPTVILLAPMMISGSDLYGQMSQFFQDSYHIIAPDQGGNRHEGHDEEHHRDTYRPKPHLLWRSLGAIPDRRGLDLAEKG